MREKIRLEQESWIQESRLVEYLFKKFLFMMLILPEGTAT